jgi:hypothetical protein
LNLPSGFGMGLATARVARMEVATAARVVSCMVGWEGEGKS